MKSPTAKKRCPNCPDKELTLESVVPNLTVKNLMGKAQVYCFTRLPELEAASIITSSIGGSTDVDAGDDDIDGDDNDQVGAAAASSGKRKSSSSSSSTGATAEKKSKPDRCTWTGKLNDARQHFNTCMYAGVVCRFGCGVIVKRIDMSEHEASACPRRRAVPCTNAGCADVMPGPLLAAHKKNDCQYEEVDCPFQSVGCNERLLRKDVKNHVDAAVNQHMLLLLHDNRSLREDNQTLRQSNQLLQQKVDDQEEMLNRQLNEIVFKVDIAKLLQGGAVLLPSETYAVGVYSVNMCVRKGFDHNGNNCGLILQVTDGHFPCRLSVNLEVVHWDGKLTSNCKFDYANTYEHAIGSGPPQMIALRKLTDAGSPYVKDGHVTFIARFQILPLA